MNTESIRQYINEIQLGTAAENDELKEKLISDIFEAPDTVKDAGETLEEMAVELTERLAQVEDEDRIKELEEKQKFIEEVISALAQRSAKTESEPEEVRSVLVAADSDVNTDEVKNSVLVSPEMIESVDQATETTVNAGKSFDTEGLSENKASDDYKELEKEAAELIRQQKKKQAEQEKEEKRREKEENKKKAENAQSQDDSGNTSDAATENSNFVASADMDVRLLEALKLYHQKTDLNTARGKLKELSNDKKLKAEDLGTARFFYAEMLLKGEGGPQDKDQARFWYEKAASNKNAEAYLRLGAIYAEKTPNNDTEKIDNAAKALKCFKKADMYQKGAGEVAKSKFVEVCKSQPITYRAKKQALKYCELLAAGKTDEYEKVKTAEERRLIVENYANNKASKYSGGGTLVKDMKDYVVIVGALITLLADYYIFMTLQNNGDRLWTLFGTDNPVIQKFTAVYSFVVERIEAFVTGIVQKLLEIANNWGLVEYSLKTTKAFTELSIKIPESLLLGMLLLFVGVFLSNVKNKEKRGRVTEYVYEVAAASTMVTIVGNVALYLVPGGSYIYFLTAVTFAVFMLVDIFLGLLASQALRN